MKILLAVMLIVTLLPVGVFAASHPFKDVNKKSVGKKANKEFTYAYKHHALDSVKGKKFYPNKIGSRGFCYNMAVDSWVDPQQEIYLEDIIPEKYRNMSEEDAAKPATWKWITQSFFPEVSDYAYGMSIQFPKVSAKKGKQKLSRILIVRFFYQMHKFDSAFEPVR